MADTDVGKACKVYREGQPVADGKVKDYEAGRDNGDHLIEFAFEPAGGGDGKAGTVVRRWMVAREKGSHEPGTFELN